MTARTASTGLPRGALPVAPQASLGLVRAHSGVLVPAVVGVAAAGVTAAGSWIPSLWGDEAATILSAARSLPSLWAEVQHVDAVHAVYYLLMHFWIGAFGASAFSVRFPSALAAGAAAAGLVVLTRMFGWGRTAAVITAAVYVALPRVAYIGQEARSFALDTALATWIVIAFTALVTRRISARTGWPLYALGVAVSAWVFPFNLLLLPALGLAVAASPHRRTIVVPWAAWSGAAILATLPLLGLAYTQRDQVAYLAASALTPSAVAVSTWFGNAFFAAVAWILIAIALAGFVFQAFRAKAALSGPSHADRPPRPPVGVPVLLTAWAILPAILLLATNPTAHLFAGRYVAFSAPALAALIVQGLRILWSGRSRLLRAWPGVVAAVCLAAVAVQGYALQRTPYSEDGSDWAQVAAYLQQHAAPGSDVLFAESVSPSKRPRNALRLYPSEFTELRDVALTTPWYDSSDTWHDLALTIGQAVQAGRVTTATVWVVQTWGSNDEGMPQLASAGYRVVDSQHFDRDTVFRMQRQASAP